MKIVFATNNQHKLEEIRHILGSSIEVLSLSDIGCHTDIPENGLTLEANALAKARYVFDHYHLSCFADDTGLEVDALGGAPGIYSARYAAMEGKGKAVLSHDSEANMARLLRELGENNNRRARFRTGEEHLFEGIVDGEITRQRSGSEGFGYDPIFRPDGYDQTFAQLGPDIKDRISHRARATQKLAHFLLSSQ